VVRRFALELHPQCHSPLSNNPKLQTLRTLLWFAARVVVSVLPLSTATATVSVDTDTACIVMDMAHVEHMDTTAAIAVTKFKEWASAPFL
jgi:hypothetical protein